MKINIIFKGYDVWHRHHNGVVLVAKKEDIEPLYKALCDQDDIWIEYRHLIKEFERKDIDEFYEISRLCEYCGKTCIYNIGELRKNFDFILYQQEI